MPIQKRMLQVCFKIQFKIEEISVQRMRKLAKTEPVYVAVVRANEVADTRKKTQQMKNK